MDKERYFMHFKGGLYKLIGYAYHSETQEEMVIYQALYGMHKIWVRPKTLFFDKVIRDGIEINRFTEIAEKEIPCLLALKKENILRTNIKVAIITVKGIFMRVFTPLTVLLFL